MAPAPCKAVPAWSKCASSGILSFLSDSESGSPTRYPSSPLGRSQPAAKAPAASSDARGAHHPRVAQADAALSNTRSLAVPLGLRTTIGSSAHRVKRAGAVVDATKQPHSVKEPERTAAASAKPACASRSVPSSAHAARGMSRCAEISTRRGSAPAAPAHGRQPSFTPQSGASRPAASASRSKARPCDNFAERNEGGRFVGAGLSRCSSDILAHAEPAAADYPIVALNRALEHRQSSLEERVERLTDVLLQSVEALNGFVKKQQLHAQKLALSQVASCAPMPSAPATSPLTKPPLQEVAVPQEDSLMLTQGPLRRPDLIIAAHHCNPSWFYMQPPASQTHSSPFHLQQQVHAFLLVPVVPYFPAPQPLVESSDHEIRHVDVAYSAASGWPQASVPYI